MGFGLGTAFTTSVDDVGFIRELINNLQHSYAIDGNRIYVSGFSLGAFMCYRLAAQLSDKIAAAAIVEGTAGGRHNSTSPWVINVGASSAQPVSMIIFQGTGNYRNGTNPLWLGGPGQYNMTYLSTNESVSVWVRHDGCSKVPQIEEISGTPHNMTKYTYSGGAKGTEVVLYKVIGGMHEWPVTATDYMWAFFKNHPKTGDREKGRGQE